MTPTISVTDAAGNAFDAAAADADGGSLHLKIDAQYKPELLFLPHEPGDIEVRSNGRILLLDPSSARRAHGVTIDFVDGPNGTGFKINNPNELPKGKQSKDRERIALKRDCVATLIPSGEQLRLSQGDYVVVTQALGGSFTVMTEQGSLARFAALDADALGLESTSEQAEAGPFHLDRVIEKLKTVFDPEIPVNVVDLGLIYVCEANLLADGGHRVEIKMSMTAPGCGMGDALKADARAKVQTVPGVTDVDIEIVWDPPWDKSRMSEAAQLQLGMF